MFSQSSILDKMGSDQSSSFNTFVLIILLIVLICIHQSSDAILLEHSSNFRRSSQSRGSGCDFLQGSWSYDDTYPLYNSSSCPFIEKPFDCQGNGRPDQLYLKFKWKPSGCQLPKILPVPCSGLQVEFRISFYDRIRGVTHRGFIEAQSMAVPYMHVARSCATIKVHSPKEWQPLYIYFPGEFNEDYKVSLMLSRNAFLVDLVKENTSIILKLDSIQNGDAWRGYDVLIFNTWHWWLHKGRLRSWDYFQEGNKIYEDMDRLVAFEKGLKTWSKWVDSNVDPSKTQVFFQGISPTHYNGEEWDSPTAKSSCIGETQPILNSVYPGGSPAAVAVVRKVLGDIVNVPVTLLDVTTLSQLRKDGHPSIYIGSSPDGNEGKDCSHWCLAGVPDTWNELLYAILVRNGQLIR